jgi:GT2 family glycosyltransferase
LTTAERGFFRQWYASANIAKETMTASLDIVIVNWNAGSQLRACLESIVTRQQACFVLGRVVVVDNASSDGSTNGLDALALPLTVIRNLENRGFGAACNQGAANGQADYLLFLNPDVVLRVDSLDKPIHWMQQPENAQVGICGIQLMDEQGDVSRTCARFPTVGRYYAKMFGLDRLFPKVFRPEFMTEWDHAETRTVDQVIGAFFMVRRSLFRSLGGFDERFFMYFDEVDLSYRARQAGWSSSYLAVAQAYHKGRGTTDQIKATRLFYSLRSRIKYGYKHFDRLAAASLALGTLLIEPIARLGFCLARGSGVEAAATLAGYVQLWRAVPTLVWHR